MCKLGAFYRAGDPALPAEERPIGPTNEEFNEKDRYNT